jgi:radical SAM protein with 4Fe4S-binding SPASM domain
MNDIAQVVDLKKTELTGVVGRDAFDTLGVVIGEAAWGEYREQYALASDLAVVTPYPLQIDFELNPSCNLRCPMCPISAEASTGKGKATWFPLERYKAIVADGVKHGLKAVKLNYINEPLIRKDLPEFVDFAVKAGVLDVYLSTNAVLLTRQMCEALVKARLTRIQVSIDAFRRETYDVMRPGGDFDKVLANIALLKSVREELGSALPLIRVNFVRTEVNEAELPDFLAYWEQRVDMIGVQEMIKPPQSSADIHSRTSRNKRKDGFRCSFPFKQIVINNEGLLLPCCTFYGEQLPLGHIDEMSVADAWHGEKITALRTTHLKGNYADNPICVQCVDGALVEDL